MRNGQNKRMRGRNNGRKNQNPLTRVYESNGPDVKIRGTASHIAEKYLQLARDAQGSGDPVAAENYFQHAEHYFRLIAAAQEQFRQMQPQQHQSFYRPEGMEPRDESFDDDADEGAAHPMMGGSEPGYGPREHQQQQPYPRENQPYPPRDGQQHYQPRDQQQQYGREHQQRPPHQGGESRGDDTDRLPSFITGGGGQPQQQQSYQQNGYENQPDRFPLHRRRRRHRGPRGDMPSSQQGDDSPMPRPPQD
ncbi:MAG TPA: DUF4167 domain-containing protein [Xanthobacteraceae bacterium]|nr:DUF4167 domain-containing protein [Xanthobacteraceae bacterium]